MGIAGGVGIIKFVNYGILALILLGLVAGIINGFIEYRKTGDASMLIDNSLGEVVTWDNKIYLAMTQLTNEEFLGTIPEEIRGEYVSAIAKGIIVNIFLLTVLIYALFRVGNWVVGLSQFSPTTDLVIIFLSIIFVFVVVPLVYGYFMHKQVTLFRGIWTFFTNFGVWWNALSGISTVAPQVVTNNAIQEGVINISGV